MRKHQIAAGIALAFVVYWAADYYVSCELFRGWVDCEAVEKF